MAARQSISVDSLDGDLAAADFPAREGLREPGAVGFPERDLDRPRRPERRLPGDPRAWRLLGGNPREVSLHPGRHLSLRSAMATGARHPLTFIALFWVSSRRSFWRKELVLVWAAALALIGVLMWGGIFGLSFVSQDRWGGLPVTLILATFGLAFGFPLGILVALGRRSRLPAIRSLCVLYVELIRDVPLISLLFMASVMFPLFMPDGVNIDKLLRAQLAVVLFAGAYLAEVIRGGLQAVPRGQHEAADALGLSYWKKNGLIILPQAIRHVIPPLVNTFIAFFKDTSLVLIIGIFDLLTTAKTAIVDPAWQSFSVEVYIFVALIYFAFCFAMSRYSRHLEAGAKST